MKFPNVIGKRELIQAAIIGSASGLIGVLFFVLLLNSMNSEQTTSEELLPVSTQPTETLPEQVVDDQMSVELFANQFGVFSSFDAATEFTSGYAELNTGAIVEIDGNYYVWSAVSPTKEGVEISVDPLSFAKKFKISSASCSESSLQQLPSLLKSNDRSKFYFEEGNVPENLPKDWQSISIALSSISNDLAVVRMHLLAHYFTENDCLKIQF